MGRAGGDDVDQMLQPVLRGDGTDDGDQNRNEERSRDPMDAVARSCHRKPSRARAQMRQTRPRSCPNSAAISVISPDLVAHFRQETRRFFATFAIYNDVIDKRGP